MVSRARLPTCSGLLVHTKHPPMDRSEVTPSPEAPLSRSMNFTSAAKGWRMEYRRSRTCITRDPPLLLCSSMEMMFFTGLYSVRPQIGSLPDLPILPEKRYGQPVLAKEFAKE